MNRLRYLATGRKIYLFFMASVLSLTVLLVMGYRSDLPPAQVERNWRMADSQFIDVRGLRVHYQFRGRRGDAGSGKPVIVLLHGSGSSSHSWNRWAGQLAQDYRVLSMDLPGAGLTGPWRDGDRGYAIRDYVLFLEAFLDRLGIRSVVLVGHSVGGEIAWRYAVEDQKKVRGLVLVAATGYPVSPPLVWQLGKMPVIGDLLSSITPRFLVRMNLEEAIGDDRKVTARMVDRYYALVRRKGNRTALKRQMRAASLKHSRLIKKIQVPALVLWGERDAWLPVSLGQKFHRDIAGSQLVRLPGVGHDIPEENQEVVVGIMEWLNKTLTKGHK